jgi:hypothetical protein
MARSLVPKHCVVHAIELDGRGNAEVRFRCVRDGMMETGQHNYPTRTGVSNYPSKRVKARSVSFRGMNVSGNARLGFVLSPAQAVCSKNGSEISCKLVGDKSSASLEGLRGRRKRR